MRVATWNINSLRLRLDLLRRLVQQEGPDVICLQEIKVEDSLFPLADLHALGYPHVRFHGMKGYNGVATLSKLPFRELDPTDWCGKGDCRHARVVLPGDVELHNFYVPAGGDIPDPAANAKFAHKLQFLDEMRDHFAAAPRAGGSAKGKAILVGDLNIAPLEEDVWSHKQLLSVVSHTPIEVEKLAAVQQAGKWVDAVRQVTPPPVKLYSWWSYRSADWTKNDRGRRLDHIWVTPSLAKRVRHATILKDMRGWTQPSDHVAVIVDLD
ncbi:exodeoxyribonuclease-3 [Dongia mobilis]|uniref:Exodeoxyribonuclease-3 n=1 Tax=Dongia mobilis TaxID=578943 RepID=A0A4R6WR90_9PROT|nr:exodeoxyribonuclease III [Dongia mobilis]TDQ82037.1 exodeoxyribonuclease-3 [Dongia mobilis]